VVGCNPLHPDHIVKLINGRQDAAGRLRVDRHHAQHLFGGRSFCNANVHS